MASKKKRAKRIMYFSNEAVIISVSSRHDEVMACDLYDAIDVLKSIADRKHGREQNGKTTYSPPP